MRKKNNLLKIGIIVLAMWASPTFATELSDKLGLVAGEYKLKSTDNNCRGGELLLRTSADGSYIQLGARILILDIEREDTTSTEQDCKVTTKNQITNGKIRSVEKTRCKDQPDFQRIITAEFQKNSFKYQIESKGKGAKHPLVKCELELIPAGTRPPEEPDDVTSEALE